MTVVNPKSISGINSITMASGSDNLLTIHTTNTTERLRINSSGDVIVGSGITVSPDGDIFATGVTTSTTFVGDLTGTASKVSVAANNDNTTYRVPFTSSDVGNVSLYSDTTSGMTYNPSTGAFSVNGAISGGTGTFSGDVTANGGDVTISGSSAILHLVDTNDNPNYRVQNIGGTFQIYDATTDTARLSIASGGAATFGGDVTVNGDELFIADSIKHVGDTDTLISFPSNDTIRFNTAGSERFRFASDGVIHVNSSDSASGGRIWANGSALYLQSGNGRQTIKVSDASVGVNRTIEMTSAGNLAFPSGNGIDFSATGDGSGASSVSELLDDYEEGEFIVTLANSLTATGVQKKLTYTKIGNKVHISGQFQVTSGGSDLTVNNLPFTTKNTGSTDETFSTGMVGLYNVTLPTDGGASGEIYTKTQKNDTNLYFVYNRTGNDPNQHTATTNGYYSVSHWYTAA